MISAPSGWDDLWNSRDSHLEVKLTVGSNEYLSDQMTNSVTVTHELFESFGMGNACSAQLSVTLLDPEPIPDGIVECRLFCRLCDGNRENPTAWVPQGVFYLDTIDDSTDGQVTITAYDAIMLAEQDYFETGVAPSGDSWPKSSSAVVSEICTKLGVTLDPRSVIVNYQIQSPDYMTVRQVLREIALSSCGNWTMTKEGKLRLVGISRGAIDVVPVDPADVHITSTPGTISQVILKADSTTSFAAGDATGMTVEGDLRGATSATAQTILGRIQNISYTGFSLTGCYFSPLLELGDAVTVSLNYADGTGKFYNTYADSVCALYEEGCWGDIEAPLTTEVNHRIRFAHAQASPMDKTVQESKDYTDKHGGGGASLGDLSTVVAVKASEFNPSSTYDFGTLVIVLDDES